MITREEMTRRIKAAKNTAAELEKQITDDVAAKVGIATHDLKELWLKPVLISLSILEKKLPTLTDGVNPQKWIDSAEFSLESAEGLLAHARGQIAALELPQPGTQMPEDQREQWEALQAKYRETGRAHKGSRKKTRRSPCSPFKGEF